VCGEGGGGGGGAKSIICMGEDDGAITTSTMTETKIITRILSYGNNTE